MDRCVVTLVLVLSAHANLYSCVSSTECQCDERFTTGDCDDDTGICHCLPQYIGPDCRELVPEYNNLQICVFFFHVNVLLMI